MKKTKIVLLISGLILITLVVVYIVSGQKDKPETVSLREQYQQELLDKSSEQ